MSPFATPVVELLVTIPGVGKRVAEVIIADIGVDMAVFPSDAHLASWAGICPGQQLLGRQAPLRPHSQGQRVAAGCVDPGRRGPPRVKDDYLSAQLWRLARRIGKKKAVIAVAHSILVIAYHVIATDQPYHDLGADYFTTRIDPERRARHLTRQLADLGYQVTLAKAA